MDQAWAKKFADEAASLGVDAVVILAGFPCKGLSRQRGFNRPNLKDKHSALWTHIPRIEELVRKELNARAPLYKIVENVVMQKDPRETLSRTLGCSPALVDVKYTCGASRPRLFWTDFPIKPSSDEQLHESQQIRELEMVPDPDRFDFWDEGFQAHPQLKGNFPCIVGWVPKSEQPDGRNTRGFATASREALQRWKDDEWSSGIRFYEDEKRAWSKDMKTARVVSPAECERMLGFRVGWTNPGKEQTSDKTPNQMRNAVGNAVAVPVISRILFSLCLILLTKPKGVTALWRTETWPTHTTTT